MSELLVKIAKTSIFKQYISLPYIIYRRKYLIPQRPLPHQPLQPILITPQTTIREVYLKYFPQVVNNPDWEKQLYGYDFKQFIKLLKEHQKEDKHDFQSRMAKYEERYLKPIQEYQKKMTPQQLFYQDQRQNILLSLKEQGKKFRINLILQYYNNIPTALKQVYQKKSELATKRIKKKLQPIVNRYRIPELNYYNSLKPYYTDYLLKTNIPQEKRVAYKDLKIQERQKFAAKANEHNKRIEEQFKAFLKRNKLTMKKYDKILNLCQAMTKQLKKNKNVSQQQAIEDMMRQTNAQLSIQSQNPVSLQQNKLKEQIVLQKQVEQIIPQSAQTIQKLIKTPDQYQLFLVDTQNQKDHNLGKQVPKKSLSPKTLKKSKVLLSPQTGQFLQQDYLEYDLQQLQLQRQIKKLESSFQKQIDKTTSKIV